MKILLIIILTLVIKSEIIIGIYTQPGKFENLPDSYKSLISATYVQYL